MLLAQPVLFKIVVENGKSTVKFYTVVTGGEGKNELKETTTPVAGVGIPGATESPTTTETPSSTEPSTTTDTAAKVAFMYVADVHQGELPKTGGVGVWFFAVLGLLICGVAAAVSMRRR